MTHHNNNITAQFFLTANQPCPYLSGRKERKLFTTLRGDEARAMNDHLSLRGFRRSQSVAYRPACADCGACLSVRVPVDAFRPTRSQRRVMKRNAGLERRACSPWATEQQYELFRAYLGDRHADGGMADMDSLEFAAMIEETTVRTRVVEYHDPAREGRDTLIGACLMDVMNDGLSMVYSFFDPAERARSLGNFMILDHIAIAREVGMPYVYLGYWVPGSSKMGYKSNFRPFECFSRGEWRQVEDLEDADIAALTRPDPAPTMP